MQFFFLLSDIFRCMLTNSKILSFHLLYSFFHIVTIVLPTVLYESVFLLPSCPSNSQHSSCYSYIHPCCLEPSLAPVPSLFFLISILFSSITSAHISCGLIQPGRTPSKAKYFKRAVTLEQGLACECSE